MTDFSQHPIFGDLLGDTDAAALWSGPAQIAHMLDFEAALTRAKGGDAALVKKIKTADINHAKLLKATARDGVPVPELVKQLRDLTGHTDALIHTGATSQDVLDTSLALTLRATSDLIQKRLTEICGALDTLTETFGENPLMGRTRMQAAVPITVGHRVVAWRAPLDRHTLRLIRLRPETEILQLSGPVGDRSTLGQDAATIQNSVANILNLGRVDQSWHTTRDAIADYANLLALITGSLGKMGQDVALMAQQGIDEITLSGGGASSAMPHKQNPVAGEILVTLARFNATQIAGMHHAMIHEQERSGAAWTLEWMILPQMAQATCKSLAIARDLCGSITRIGTRS